MKIRAIAFDSTLVPISLPALRDAQKARRMRLAPWPAANAEVDGPGGAQ